MLLVDAAVGSRELVGPLVKLGLPAELTHLDFGDLAFEGLGEGGKSTSVGIEFKLLPELVQALTTKRLQGHQVPGMCRTYDHRWLLVEGAYRHDDAGRITTYKGKSRGWVPLPGRMTATELEKQLFSIGVLCGFHIRFVDTRADSLRVLCSLYRWFSDVAIDKHSSHITTYQPPTLTPLSDCRRVLCTLPGVGLRTSKVLEKWCGGSLRIAFQNISVGRLADIEIVGDGGKTRRFGEKAAQKIVEFLK